MTAFQFGPYALIDDAGNVQPTATVTVRNAANTGKTAVYEDSALTLLDNPLPTGVATGQPGVDGDGVVIFYAPRGRYTLRITVGAVTTDYPIDVVDTGRLILGILPPRGESVLDPIVGEWGWSDHAAAWFGPAYEVSWQAGDDVGVVPYIPGAGTGAVQPSILVGAGPFESDQPAPGIPQYDWSASPIVTTATEAGSGIIFLIQQEEGFGGPTTPARPTLDVLDYLGDLVLTNGITPVPWAPEQGDGADGDVFINSTTKVLYGPRAAGSWPNLGALNNPLSEVSLSASADVPIFEGYPFPSQTADLIVVHHEAGPGDFFRVTATGAVYAEDGVVLSSPNGTDYRLVVANDGTLSTELA